MLHWIFASVCFICTKFMLDFERFFKHFTSMFFFPSLIKYFVIWKLKFYQERSIIVILDSTMRNEMAIFFHDNNRWVSILLWLQNCSCEKVLWRGRDMAAWKRYRHGSFFRVGKLRKSKSKKINNYTKGFKFNSRRKTESFQHHSMLHIRTSSNDRLILKVLIF